MPKNARLNVLIYGCFGKKELVDVVALCQIFVDLEKIRILLKTMR